MDEILEQGYSFAYDAPHPEEKEIISSAVTAAENLGLVVEDEPVYTAVSVSHKSSDLDFLVNPGCGGGGFVLQREEGSLYKRKEVSRDDAYDVIDEFCGPFDE